MLNTTELSIEQAVSDADLVQALNAIQSMKITFQADDFDFAEEAPAVLVQVTRWDQGWATILWLTWTFDLSERDLAAALAVQLGRLVAVGAESPAPENLPCFLVFRPDGRVDRGAESHLPHPEIRIIEEGVTPSDFG